MADFKVAGADEIEEARIDLKAKIKSDTEAMEENEGSDAEVESQDVNPGGEEARSNDQNNWLCQLYLNFNSFVVVVPCF